MSFLDPAEKNRISELLNSRQPMAAAEILIASRVSDHKSIRPLVTECVSQLAALAQAALDQDDLFTASEHISRAAELRPLSGSQAVLQKSILRRLEEFVRIQRLQKSELDQAKRQMQAGRYQTSIANLEPFQQMPEAAQLIEVQKSRLSTLERHFQRFEDLLEQDQMNSASLLLERMKSEAPQAELTLTAECRFRKVIPEMKPEESQNPQLVRVRDGGFVMDFGDTSLNTLVLTGRHSFVLGAPKSDGSAADIRISGRLHQQHAILVRHLRHGQMCYYLMPHPSNNKYVAVNGQVLSVGTDAIRPWSHNDEESKQAVAGESPIGCALLQNGDTIRLGISEDNCVSLRFSQKCCPKSLTLRDTAVLAMEDTPARSSSIVSAQDTPCRTVVLFHENVLLGAGQDVDVHMDTDCRFDLSLTQSGDMIQTSCTGAVLLCDGLDGQEYDDDLLRYRTESKVRTVPSFRESQEDFEQEPQGIAWRIRQR